MGLGFQGMEEQFEAGLWDWNKACVLADRIGALCSQGRVSDFVEREGGKFPSLLVRWLTVSNNRWVQRTGLAVCEKLVKYGAGAALMQVQDFWPAVVHYSLCPFPETLPQGASLRHTLEAFDLAPLVGGLSYAEHADYVQRTDRALVAFADAGMAQPKDSFDRALREFVKASDHFKKVVEKDSGRVFNSSFAFEGEAFSSATTFYGRNGRVSTNGFHRTLDIFVDEVETRGRLSCLERVFRRVGTSMHDDLEARAFFKEKKTRRDTFLALEGHLGKKYGVRRSFLKEVYSDYLGTNLPTISEKNDWNRVVVHRVASDSSQMNGVALGLYADGEKHLLNYDSILRRYDQFLVRLSLTGSELPMSKSSRRVMDGSVVGAFRAAIKDMRAIYQPVISVLRERHRGGDFSLSSLDDSCLIVPPERSERAVVLPFRKRNALRF